MGRKWLESITRFLARSPGVLFDFLSDVGNSTTSETNLYSSTITPNTLELNGDKIAAEYSGTVLVHATATRQIRAYFAGTAIFDTGALTIGATSTWNLRVRLIRISASVVRYSASLITGGVTTQAYNSSGELTGLDLSASNILKVTGQAAGVGAATNDIVAKIGLVEWKPAA